jgi:Calcineurin-like phosphoesterase
MRAMSLRLLAAVAMLGGLILPGRVVQATAAEPPRFEVPSQGTGPLVFVVYGDTRFTQRGEVVNAVARRALVDRIASEKPAAILIGGDLVYQGSDPRDYQTYRSETAAWSKERIAVFPALGNHEFKGCARDSECLENWWSAFPDLSLRPNRWYSVAVGSNLLALVLDSDASLKAGSEQRAWFEEQMAGAGEQVEFILILMHYPPVRDPIFPHGRDEKEIARYLSRHAKYLRPRVLVVGSHVHNYERYSRDGVTYVVSGGGGAKPVPVPRLFGEQSHLRTSVNFHYLRLTLWNDRLTCVMVRYDAAKDDPADAWTEPDAFEIRARN